MPGPEHKTIRELARAAGGEIRRAAFEPLFAWIDRGPRDEADGAVVRSGQRRYRLVRGEDGALYGVEEEDR